MNTAVRTADEQTSLVPEAAATVVGSTGTDDPRERALARLARSRQQLRAALLPPPAPPRAASTGGAWRAGPGRWWRQLRRWAGHSPVALAAVGAVRGWWRSHPWRPAAEAGSQELRSQLVPVIRQYPWVSVAVAAGLGAALVSQRRPLMRWASVHAQPVPGQLAQWAWQQASSPATQAWLAGWLLSRTAAGTKPAGAAQGLVQAAP